MCLKNINLWYNILYFIIKYIKIGYYFDGIYFKIKWEIFLNLFLVLNGKE